LCMTEIKKPQFPMDFQALALFTADHAVVENGKVYVNGGFWDILNQPSYPADVSFSLVVVIKVPARAYLENHQLVVEMVDADEVRLPLRIEGNVRVGPAPHMNPGEPSTLSFAFPLNGVRIERVGDYFFVLSVDGDELARYRIRAIQLVPVPQPTEGNEAEQE
jgi:hypothetical protein